MPVKRLKEDLDSHGIKYVLISHSPAYTAQEIAASAHVPGKELAKTVMVKVDGALKMVVLPASAQIDFKKIKDEFEVSEAELATEREFVGSFPDCETGAMPPFGELYDMDVFVDETLTEDEEIFFNAGTHRELVRMSYKDFADHVKPKVIQITK